MDILRRKRLSLPGQLPASGSLSQLDTSGAMGSSPVASSPSSSLEGSKGEFLQFIVPKAIKSLSRGSTPRSPSAESAHDSGNFPPSSRRVLHKHHSRSASGFEFITRRGSTSSEAYSRVSRASTTVSGSSANSLDWKNQGVERHAKLEPDPQHLRHKAGYLVITADYIVVFKSKADALAALPQIVIGNTRAPLLQPPEPMQVIPISLVVAVFKSESPRPSFGFEVWWRSPYPSISFCSTEFFFAMPGDRGDMMRCLLDMMRWKTRELPGAARIAFEVEDAIRKIFQREESGFAASEPEIFPVAYRSSKPDDKGRKSHHHDGTSFYLAVGINMCFFVEVGKASAVQEAALDIKYRSFGVVTLESFHGHWSPHEERFLLTFRDPFQEPVTLELASRYYKQIILTLMKADKYLKPAWPTVWQTKEIFLVRELPEPQQIVAGEDFGGFQRTLAAYAAAYHCEPVEWEINWKTQLAPEFRVLPPRKGSSPYSCLQILAVFRALRYNDYFNSLSFRDVDLYSIWDKYETVRRRGSAAYTSRSGVCLNDEEAAGVDKASLLHQEVHALAFTSETIRQIDFTNTLKPRPGYRGDASQYSVQFLSPILDLLKAGLTRCNRIILRGCALGIRDVDDLVDALNPGLPLRGGLVGLEVLDISKCGLSDSSLQSLFEALHYTGHTLQVLNVSGNFGRVPAPLASSLLSTMVNLRSLNLSGSLMGTVDGELISRETLSRFHQLEELNLSGFKLNEATLLALQQYLLGLSTGQIYQGRDAKETRCALRRLILNNCGITGLGAGRLFNAMTGLDDVHLQLSSNPLETDIDYLVRAIGQCWKGTIGLHMGMVEFKDEASFVSLLDALAVSEHVHFLSLAGTAPTPTADATCGRPTCEALERFLAENESVRFLDLSGYSGKLDEGQLGHGFGRALRGLAQNRTVTHLRVRNQNLHDDIGELGLVIRTSASLRYLDCEDNNFNLTSLRFMAQSLEENRSILDFRLTAEERTRILNRCLQDMPTAARQQQSPATSSSTSLSSKQRKKSAASDAAFEKQRAVLRSAVDEGVAAVQAATRRNRATLERETGCVVELDELPAAETGGSAGWPSLRLRTPEGATPTNAAQEAAQQAELLLEQQQEHYNQQQLLLLQERATVHSSSVPPDTALQTPYHVQQDDDALHSPAETAAAASPCPGEEDTAPMMTNAAPPTVQRHEVLVGVPANSGAGHDDDDAAADAALGPEFAYMWSHFKLASSD